MVALKNVIISETSLAPQHNTIMQTEHRTQNTRCPRPSKSHRRHSQLHMLKRQDFGSSATHSARTSDLETTILHMHTHGHARTPKLLFNASGALCKRCALIWVFYNLHVRSPFDINASHYNPAHLAQSGSSLSEWSAAVPAMFGISVPRAGRVHICILRGRSQGAITLVLVHHGPSRDGRLTVIAQVGGSCRDASSIC